MPVKFIPSHGNTVYSFGGGANTVQVLSEADTTAYTVDLGGGDDNALLGAGNDTVIGSSGSDIIAGGQGNDLIYGGETTDGSSNKTSTDTLYGDSSGEVSTSSFILGDDVLNGAGGSTNFTNVLYGDANVLSGDAVAGDDTVNGGDSATNTLYGDAGTIMGDAVAGNDTLTGGDGSSNIMYGDASGITGSSGTHNGGNDTLIGGNGPGTTNNLFGDASGLTASAGATVTGGDDILIAGISAANTLYGDAQLLFATGTNSIVVGGDDLLIAGDGGTNTLYGDAQRQFGAVFGGNDTLVSGIGNDTMWGDVATVTDAGVVVGGADVFRFLQGSGADLVMDFRVGDLDVIDVQAYGFADFTALSAAISVVGSDTLINLGGGNQVTLSGVTDTLDASSFLI